MSRKKIIMTVEEKFLLRKQSTERGVALGAAALLERPLENILRAYFIGKKTADNLLKPLRPLATFSARIQTAFALGIISKRERDNLNLIRDIRNEFAHSEDVSFQTPAIRTNCMNLKPRR